MTTRTHALFTPATSGPDLDISQGGEILQPADTGLSNARTARASVGRAVGVWSFEMMAYPTATTPVISDPLDSIVGIATEDADLSDYLGADGYGIGYELATGDIHAGGSVVATVAPAGEGDIIGVQADLADGAVTFLVNGTPVHTQGFDSGLMGETFYPAASMGSGPEADARLFLNSGQRAFEFPLADSDGWYSIPATIDTLRFADGQTYFSAPTDDIPNAEFRGVVAGSAVTIVRGLNFWPWGSEQSRGSAAQFILLDPRGEWDSLIGANLRDLPVTIQEVADGSVPLSAAKLVFSGVLEKVDALDDGRKRVTLRDRTAVLDQPIQSRLFLPNLAEDIANRPVPIVIGVARSIAPVLFDDGLDSSGALPLYQVADRAMQGFGALRDKGDPLAIGVDWAIRTGGQAIELYENPIGKLTLDVSSIGGDTITNIVPTTRTDWDTSVNVTGTTTYTFGDGSLTINGRLESYLTEGSVLTADRSYGFILVIDSMSEGVSQTGVPVRVSIGEGVTADVNGPILNSPHFSATSAGTYTGSFTAAATGPITLGLRGVVTITNASVVSRFEVFEAADTTSDTLQPATVTQFAREVLQTRGGLTADEWSQADAEAIDAATGYAGVGYFTREPVSVGQALQEALTSYTACHWQDSAGRIRFTRLIDPASQTPTGTITPSVMKSDLVVTRDDAPGLTAQMAGRRNWEVLSATDFVSDFVDVPFAVRRVLSRRFRAVRTTGVPFPSEYAHARGATDPVETLLDSPADLQAEIDRVAALYTVVRYFYLFSVPIEAIGEYELGQTWTLQYWGEDGSPRYNLGAGKPCLLTSITEDRVNHVATLRLWG
jgi:hypothetical protein